jgi:hypothetical protein
MISPVTFIVCKVEMRKVTEVSASSNRSRLRASLLWLEVSTELLIGIMGLGELDAADVDIESLGELLLLEGQGGIIGRVQHHAVRGVGVGHPGQHPQQLAGGHVVSSLEAASTDSAPQVHI